MFVESYAPPPRMLVFGAIDFAAAVARIGSFLGYRVTVCDARAVFATARRFPDADEVVVEWPHRYLGRGRQVDERTVICVLTHDPKFDVPLLEVALRTPAWYVGAMGSRRTHDDRLDRLREAGMTEDELARLRSPIGLDLGARTPEETAVSVAAEIVAGRWGGTGVPLGPDRGRHPPRRVTRRADRGRGRRAVARAGARRRRRQRYGSPKALVRLRGRLLVERAADLLAAGGCDPVVVVLGAAADEVLAAAAAGRRTVVNPDWPTGMGSSLRVGLAAVPAEARGGRGHAGRHPRARPGVGAPAGRGRRPGRRRAGHVRGPAWPPGAARPYGDHRGGGRRDRRSRCRPVVGRPPRAGAARPVRRHRRPA